MKPLGYYVGGLPGTQDEYILAEIEERYGSQLQQSLDSQPSPQTQDQTEHQNREKRIIPLTKDEENE